MPDEPKPEVHTDEKHADGKPTDAVFDLLKQWPYASKFIRDTLDPELIAAHGEWLLCRALNIGNLVAFMGSGASLSYGRVSWGELVRGQLREVVSACDDASREAGDKPLDPRWEDPETYKKEIGRLIDRWKSRNVGIWRLLETMKQLPLVRGDGAEELRADRYPIVLQLCEQLSRALDAHLGRLPDAESFRLRVGQLTINDVEHANRLLTDLLSDKGIQLGIEQYLPKQETNRGPNPRTYVTLHNDPGHGKSPSLRGFFTNRHIHNILKSIDSNFRGEARRVLEALSAPSANVDSHSQLLPLKRYLVPALLRLMNVGAAGTEDTRMPETLEAGIRSDEIAPANDPLLILHRDLKIRRFLTTNYDLEIETLFRDLGFQSEKYDTAPASERGYHDPLGAGAKAFVFKPQLAGELVDFAMADDPSALRVAHLHGASDQPDTLVITEHDYQRLYLSDVPNREIIDDAIRLAFGASPLLFVGMGMTEDDLLRPLRQFMSERHPRRDRLAVALLPALGTPGMQAQDQISLYLRFGVHSIFYGDAEFTKESAANRFDDPYWLWRFVETVKALRQLLKPSETKGRPSEYTLGPNCRRLATDTTTCAFAHPPELGGAMLDEKTFPAQFLALQFRFRQPIKLSGYRVEGAGAAHIHFEIALVNAALDFLRELRGGTLESAAQGRLKKFYVEVLEGVEGAVIAAAMTSKLAHFCDRWTEWRQRWDDDHLVRKPFFGTFPPAEKADRSAGDGSNHPTEPKREERKGHGPEGTRVRHDIILPRPWWDPKESLFQSDRFAIGGPAQSFDTFIDALSATARGPGRWSTGRRIFVVLTERGVGKGHFFSSLKHYKNMSRFTQACWPRHDIYFKENKKDDAKYGKPKLRYRARYLMNFSMSQEIMSVFDGVSRDLIELLVQDPSAMNAVAEVHRGKPDRRRREDPPLSEADLKAEFHKLSRAEKLRYAFELWSQVGAAHVSPAQRIFIGFNSIDVLFETGGQPKNAQASAIFNALIDKRYQEAPIDFLITLDEKTVPITLRAKSRQTAEAVFEGLERPDFRIARRPGQTLRGQIDTDAQIDRSGINPQGDGGEFANVVHVLRPPRGSFIASSFFPEIVAVLVIEATRKHCDRTASESAFLRPEPTRWAVKMREQGRRWKGLRKLLVSAHKKRKKSDDAILRKIVEFCVRKSKYSIQSEGTSQDRIQTEVDRRFKDAFVKLAGRRFAFTLFLAAVDEMIDDRPFDEIMADIDSFWNGTLAEVARAGKEGTEDRVMLRVLAAFERRHALRRRPPRFDLSVGGELRTKVILGKRRKIDVGPALFHLQRAILRHLAVIGQPVEAEVLLACPEINKVVAKLPNIEATLEGLDREGQSLASERRRLFLLPYIHLTMDLLVRRCLVFRIAPHREAARTDNMRFALHRLMQRHVFRVMDGPLVEFARADPFIVTLYAQHPRELPRLNPQSYAFLRDLTAALSYQPVDPSRLPEAMGKDVNGIAMSSRRLRAAYGIVRSVLSLSVISRLDHAQSMPDADGLEGGFLESHRVRLLWLLKASQEIARRARNLKRASETIETKEDAEAEIALVPPPFYSDEIVWLYNEAGLISFVQGRLDDAAMLLRRAETEAHQHGIEPGRRDGPVRARININRSICDIERGRTQQADDRLARIERLPAEHEALKAIARGYRGLVAHVSGNVELAEENYSEAIDKLRMYKRTRATAIFHVHRGDLLRAKGKHFFDKAREDIRAAIALAGGGGHEDVSQQARFSELTLRVHNDEKDGIPGILQEADQIERFARRMGIVRLSVDIHRLRGELLLKLGEVRLAGRVAATALELAALHGMTLRKIRAMILLARTYIERGEAGLALPVLRNASRLAQKSGYQIGKDTSDSLLARCGTGIGPH